jgi:hypothetical protein
MKQWWRNHYQGDQIGWIFAEWAFVYLEQFLQKYNSRPNVEATFFHEKSNVYIVMGLATFWADSSQTRPVTLIIANVAFQEAQLLESGRFGAASERHQFQNGDFFYMHTYVYICVLLHMYIHMYIRVPKSHRVEMFGEIFLWVCFD